MNYPKAYEEHVETASGRLALSLISGWKSLLLRYSGCIKLFVYFVSFLVKKPASSFMESMKSKSITFILITGILLSACSPQKTEEEASSATPEKEEKSAVEEKASNATVSANAIAMINDQPIREDIFNAFLEFKRIPPEEQSRVSKALEHYLEREALTHAIENTDLLDHALAETEVNEFRKQIYISRYFEKFLSESVNEAVVRNYYVAHQEEYATNKVRVAHILVRTNPKMSTEELQAKRTAAHEIYSKLKTGEDFAGIAKQYSEDKISAEKGGDLGWIAEGGIDPTFSERIFAMLEGELSEPFQTAFGYHIVKVLAGPQVVKQPFESVKGDIRYQLRNEAKQAEIKRLLSTVSVVRPDTGTTNE